MFTVLATKSHLTACFQSVGPGRSSGRGSSPSLTFISLSSASQRQQREPAQYSLCFPQALFLLLIANAYRVRPTSQALGQGECAGLQAHALQARAGGKIKGTGTTGRCPEVRSRVLGWKMLTAGSGGGRDSDLPTTEESISPSPPQKRRQEFMVNVKSIWKMPNKNSMRGGKKPLDIRTKQLPFQVFLFRLDNPSLMFH